LPKGSNGLNEKQAMFCLEYIKDFNATQAAIRVGYSEKTAGSRGASLMQISAIQERIAANVAERSERAKVDADWLLKRLALEAEADLNDLYSEDGGLKPVNQWPKIWRQGLVSGIDSHQEYEYIAGEKVPAGVVQKIKLSDRVKRLEMIGKHVDVSAFSENHNHTGSVSIAIADILESIDGTSKGLPVDE